MSHLHRFICYIDNDKEYKTDILQKGGKIVRNKTKKWQVVFKKDFVREEFACPSMHACTSAHKHGEESEGGRRRLRADVALDPKTLGSWPEPKTDS